MEHQVKVKISTTLYLMPKMKIFPKQLQLFWSLIVCLLTVTVLHKFCKLVFLRIYFKNQPFRLFCNSVGFQFEKSIQVVKNQIWNFDVG